MGKLHQCRKKDVLMDVLPVDICCKVSEYFGCLRFEWIKERERDFFTEYMNYNHGLTRPELQIVIFRIYKEHISIEIQTSFHKDFKKAIDRLLDGQSVKDKYINNKMTLQALKSYCKKNIFGIKYAVRKCKHPKKFKELFRYFITDEMVMYRREYILKDFVRTSLIEYIDDLIGSDKKYCDMEGIRGHIRRLFN